MITGTMTAPGLVDVAKLCGDLYVDGTWRPSSSGKRIDVFDPSNEQRLTTVANATVEDGLAAVEAASKAAASWAAKAPREGGEILRHSFSLIVDLERGLAELISLENG